MTPKTGLAVRILCCCVIAVPLAIANLPSVGAPHLRPPTVTPSSPGGASVAAPVVTPAAIAVGASTVVRVSSFITSGAGPSLIANSVNLIQVDGTGKALAILGKLNDSGMKGDLVAGDQIYSGEFTFHQTVPGTIYLQVSAAFQGMLRRVLSVSSPLEVLPAGVPTQPRYFPNSQIVTDSNGRRMSCDQVLAFFKPGTSVASIYTLAASIGGAIVGFLPGAQLHTWQIQINCTSAQGVLNAINTLSNSSVAAGAEPNYIVTASGVIPNDPGYVVCATLPNGAIPCLGHSAAPELRLIRADEAWAITQGLSPSSSNTNIQYPGPIIGIVDSGVDNTQEDMSGPGKVINGFNFVASPMTNDTMDDDGHGTAVAGIAAADGNNGVGIPGVSWASPIVAEKVLDSMGTGTPTTAAEGINDAVSRGAKIINLSLGDGLGGAPDVEYAIAIDKANRAGALVVAGAGNDYCSQPEYPAGFGHQTTFSGTTFNTTVLSVGGIDFAANVANVGGSPSQCQKGNGSNFGTWVDIYAPFFGYTTQAHQCNPIAIPNCFPGETDFFDSGTSFSAPFVSGAAALVWAANPQLSASDVMNTLISTADPTLPDPMGNSTARLDVFTAVFQAAAIHCSACPQAPEVSVARSTIYNGPMVTVGVPGRASTDVQNKSVHGVSVALTPIIGKGVSSGNSERTIPLAYQLGVVLLSGDQPGGIVYFLNTYDSYTSGAYFDSFSVSTSFAPYWELGLQGPLQPFAIPMADPLGALLSPFPGPQHTCESTAFPSSSPATCAFTALFVIGGQNRGSSLQTFQTSLAGLTRADGSAPVLPGGVFGNSWLNFVLDTASPPNSDNQFPSSGVFHIFDITPLCLNNQNPIGIQPSTGPSGPMPNCVAP
jgi:thermitase